jgi:hypothetical protein
MRVPCFTYMDDARDKWVNKWGRRGEMEAWVGGWLMEAFASWGCACVRGASRRDDASFDVCLLIMKVRCLID